MPDFSRAAKTYRQNAVVQKIMAKNLCDLLVKHCGENFDKILEIGSGTGFLTDNITGRLKYRELFLNDITDNYTSCQKAVFLKGDASKTDLPKGCNLIISNAAIQWIDDLEPFLFKIKKCLSPGGIFVFSAFGEENFKEFKKICNEGLIYKDYYCALADLEYEIIEYERELYTMYFSSPREVLRHIKTTGVALKNGEKWTKERLKTFEESYRKLFYDANGAALTYAPLYFVARPI